MRHTHGNGTPKAQERNDPQKRWLGPRMVERYEALRDVASVVALATAVVLAILVLSGAGTALLAAGWATFVLDLVVLRLAARRLQEAVEYVPARLPSWRRLESDAVLFEV